MVSLSGLLMDTCSRPSNSSYQRFIASSTVLPKLLATRLSWLFSLEVKSSFKAKPLNR